MRSATNINIGDWDNWRWQLAHSINNFAALVDSAYLSSKQKELFVAKFGLPKLPFQITPYFASLITADTNCPILLQVMPTAHENIASSVLKRDPLGEEPREVVPHLIHRYPDRVLFFATDRCASYCRFCTRKRFVGQGPTPKKTDHQKAFEYIKKNPHIKEIIFSGGDPLLLANSFISNLLEQAQKISHIDFLRIHTRMLSFAPMRIDPELLEIFSKVSNLILITHFNHPKEITSYAKKYLKLLIESGVQVYNQSVLLRNINNSKQILIKLFRELGLLGVKSYYLHQCDIVEGADHFRVPIEEAIDLVSSMRGHISGYLLPNLVLDIPGGLGKIHLSKNCHIKQDKDYYYFQGFKGEIGKYPKN